MSSCAIQTDCDILTDESSYWSYGYGTNCTSCWNDNNAIITGGVPAHMSWPLIGRECLVCVRIDPSCIKRQCCDLILDYTRCFVNDGTVFIRIWFPLMASLLLCVFISAWCMRKRIMLLYRCCDFRVIPGYFALLFFVFAIGARRSVQQTCHHINRSSCASETTLNYIIIAISIIFVLYIIYWMRHSYKKDPRAFYLRDVELQSSLQHPHTSSSSHGHTHGRSSGHVTSLIGATSRSDNDENDDMPRSRTSTHVDFGVTVTNHHPHHHHQHRQHTHEQYMMLPHGGDDNGDGTARTTHSANNALLGL